MVEESKSGLEKLHSVIIDSDVSSEPSSVIANTEMNQDSVTVDRIFGNEYLLFSRK